MKLLEVTQGNVLAMGLVRGKISTLSAAVKCKNQGHLALGGPILGTPSQQGFMIVFRQYYIILQEGCHDDLHVPSLGTRIHAHVE